MAKKGVHTNAADEAFAETSKSRWGSCCVAACEYVLSCPTLHAVLSCQPCLSTLSTGGSPAAAMLIIVVTIILIIVGVACVLSPVLT